MFFTLIEHYICRYMRHTIYENSFEYFIILKRKLILRDEKSYGPRCVAPRDSNQYLHSDAILNIFFLINFKNKNNNDF